MRALIEGGSAEGDPLRRDASLAGSNKLDCLVIPVDAQDMAAQRDAQGKDSPKAVHAVTSEQSVATVSPEPVPGFVRSPSAHRSGKKYIHVEVLTPIVDAPLPPPTVSSVDWANLRVAFVDDEAANQRVGGRFLRSLGVSVTNTVMLNDGMRPRPFCWPHF